MNELSSFGSNWFNISIVVIMIQGYSIQRNLFRLVRSDTVVFKSNLTGGLIISTIKYILKEVNFGR